MNVSDTDIRWARQTISRFYAGETTVGDESRLQAFFDAHPADLPDDLAEESRIFSKINSAAPVESTLSQFAEDYIATLAREEMSPSAGKKVYRRLWISVASAAAVALILVISGVWVNNGSENTVIAESEPHVMSAAPANPAAPLKGSVNREKYVEASEEPVVSRLKNKLKSSEHGITSSSSNVADIEASGETVPVYIEVTDSAAACRIIEYSLRLVAEQVHQARDAAEMAQSSLIDNLKTIRDLTPDKIENYENDNVI